MMGFEENHGFGQMGRGGEQRACGLFLAPILIGDVLCCTFGLGMFIMNDGGLDWWGFGQMGLRKSEVWEFEH
jgi:hypothetical protein